MSQAAASTRVHKRMIPQARRFDVMAFFLAPMTASVEQAGLSARAYEDKRVRTFGAKVY